MFNQILLKFALLVVFLVLYQLHKPLEREGSRGGIASSMSPLNDSLIVRSKQTSLFHIEHCFRPDLPKVLSHYLSNLAKGHNNNNKSNKQTNR